MKVEVKSILKTNLLLKNLGTYSNALSSGRLDLVSARDRFNVTKIFNVLVFVNQRCVFKSTSTKSTSLLSGPFVRHNIRPSMDKRGLPLDEIRKDLQDLFYSPLCSPPVPPNNQLCGLDSLNDSERIPFQMNLP